ncbi:hypothetical protein QYF61_012605 [Mycteria americana]|uniref:ribonuclease H n=1 Tax=Mycteria americana TaxID=33587 RepID=A0AAN7RHE4_MYCAM|nr:hypothetical protein QYF61_012605 [Mycteria americana]
MLLYGKGISAVTLVPAHAESEPGPRQELPPSCSGAGGVAAPSLFFFLPSLRGFAAVSPIQQLSPDAVLCLRAARLGGFAEKVWFTVLDLKDAFFCLPLSKESQNLFAFEWESPTTGRKPQLTWTVLPQGFKNSPTIFGNQLARELETWDPPSRDGTLLQYVDDLLIATETKPDCIQWTINLLNFLGLNGYRVSQQKAQMVRQQVTYLGYELSGGQRELGTERKEAICRTPLPQTVGVDYGFTIMDVTKPFWLFSHEKQGIALGVLAQRLGLYKRTVAYFSKQRVARAILVEPDDVNIEVTNVTNPAFFLSGVTSESLIHDCLETIETVYSSRPDLKEEPLEDAQDSWFTDGSSFVRQGIRKAGYTVTTASKVIESQSLPAGTSAQKAEIIALTRALELAKGKKINIWTDSKYAFGVVHAHGAIWKE